MKHAIDWHSESLVDADVARKNHPFTCPHCWKVVTLAKGDINAAYFRHNDASPSCPDYHPGLGASSQWDTHQDTRFPLRLACADAKWTLYFKLPELQEEEIRSVEPRDLRALAVGLLHQNGDMTSINGLELWPGAGTSTVTVNPANQIRRTYTQGKWPRWDVNRWNNTVQEIPAMGAIFSQDRGGDYVLCTASRPLYLGRSAVFVAQEPTSPPRWLRSSKLENHDGFAAWHFVAPQTSDTDYSRWLTQLGTAIAETHDPSTVLTPPIDYRNDETHVIRANDCAIVAPSSVAEAIVAQSSLEFQPLRLRSPDEFVRLSGNFHEARLRTRSGDQIHVVKEDLPTHGKQFGHSQLWGITVEGRVCNPYSVIEIEEIRQPRLGIDTELSLRFTATVNYPHKPPTRLSHADSESVRNWLRVIDSNACMLEVDAGSFGIIRIISARHSRQIIDADCRTDTTGTTPQRLASTSDIRRIRQSSPNETNRSQWDSAFVTLRADDRTPRPYWVLEGRRNSNQYWRIQR